MRFTKDEFLSNVLKMFTGTAGSHVLWAVSMLAVARMYAPEYFGEGQLFISAASILSVIATGRYEQAIVVPCYRFQAMNLLLFSLALSLFGVVLMFPVLLIFSDAILRVTGISAENLLLLPVYVLELCLYALFYAWLLREKRFATLAKGLMLFPAVYLGFCTMFHFIWIPVHKLVLATILARGMEILYFGCFLREYSGQYFRRFSWKGVWTTGKVYVDFPKYMLVGSFVDSARQHAVPFLISAFWGMTATGYYSMAMQVLAAPAGLIAKSVGSVFQQEASRLYGKYRECRAFYEKNLKICIGYSAFICICAYIAIPTIVPVLMGEKWNIAGHYVHLLLPMTFVTLVSSPLSVMYIIARCQRSYLKIQTANFLGSVVILGLAGRLGGSIELALLAWGAVVMIVSGIGIYGGRKIAKGLYV